jgi:hypothetical protein
METKDTIANKKLLNIRPKTLPQEIINYIDRKLKRQDATITGIIIDLMQKGLNHLEQGEPSSPLHAERGKDIDTYPKVKRGDYILLPCPRTNRWVDKKLDCEGCKLKCPLTTDQKKLFEGLALYAET